MQQNISIRLTLDEKLPLRALRHTFFETPCTFIFYINVTFQDFHNFAIYFFPEQPDEGDYLRDYRSLIRYFATPPEARLSRGLAANSSPPGCGE